MQLPVRSSDDEECVKFIAWGSKEGLHYNIGETLRLLTHIVLVCMATQIELQP